MSPTSITTQSGGNLVLFSSNARPRYVQDILNTLALPEGAVYRFRYDYNLIGEEFRSPTFCAMLNNQQALLVFVEQPKDRNATTDGKIRFFPYRRVVVRDIKPDGRVLLVEFELGKYVDWRSGAKQIQAYHDIIKSLPDNNRPVKIYAANSSVDLDSLIPSVSAENSTQSWQGFIEATKTVPDFANALFFRVSDLREIGEPLWSKFWRMINKSAKRHGYSIVHPLKEILPGLSGYEVRSGTTNRLNLSFYLARDPHQSPLKDRGVSFDLDTKYFSYVQKPIPIGFRYDTYPLYLVVTTLNQDVITTLEIGLTKQQSNVSPSGGATATPANPQIGGTNTPTQTLALEAAPTAPELTILLRLNYPRMRLALNFILLFLAQVVTVASGKLEGILKWLKLDQTTIDMLKPLDPILGVAGPLLTSIILVVLFRRLPSVKD